MMNIDNRNYYMVDGTIKLYTDKCRFDIMYNTDIKPDMYGQFYERRIKFILDNSNRFYHNLHQWMQQIGPNAMSDSSLSVCPVSLYFCTVGNLEISFDNVTRQVSNDIPTKLKTVYGTEVNFIKATSYRKSALHTLSNL